MDYVDQIVKTLIDHDVRFAFGVTGSGASLQLIHALEQHHIPYYPAAHEAAAAIMAGACSRSGKMRAAAISIKGPGFINLLPGMLSNFYEGRPALTISEAYISADPPHRKHKRLDHYAICCPIVKAYAQADTSGQALSNLIGLANQEFPGPVHLDLVNKPAKSTEAITGPAKPVEKTNPARLDNVITRIRNSRYPAVILGSLAARGLKGLDWNSLKVPVATTAAAKGCINERREYAAGVITGEGKELSPEQAVLEKADLIIAFGLRNTEVVTAKPFAAPLVIIDVIAGDIHCGFEAEAVLVDPETPTAASSIFAELLHKAWGEDIIDHYRHKLQAELFHDPWLTPAIFNRIQNLAPDNTILVLDTGLFCTIGETVWKAAAPDDFCSSSNGRFMCTAIPTAIGAGISTPEKRVICVTGDGGVRPYLSEIKLAVELKLPILFILMSDGLYGTVAMSAISKGIDSSAFVIKDRSWWRSIEAMGCPSALVSTPNEIDKTISCWLQNRGPFFMEMRFDPLKYIDITKRLR